MTWRLITISPTKRTFIHKSKNKGIPAEANRSGYCSYMSVSNS